MRRACLTRSRWGQYDRSVPQPAEYFLGEAPGIGTCAGRHWEVRCRTTSHQPSNSSLALGQRPELLGQTLEGVFSPITVTFCVVYLPPPLSFSPVVSWHHCDLIFFI